MSKVTMPEPFMYGIMEPDGTPYFGELCVSGNKGDLDDEISDLNDGNEAGLYQEVALITTTQAEAYADAKVREALESLSVKTRRPCLKCRGTGIEEHHFHGVWPDGEACIEPIKCERCEGFGTDQVPGPVEPTT